MPEDKQRGFRIEVKDGEDQIFFFSILPEKIAEIISWIFTKKEPK